MDRGLNGIEIQSELPIEILRKASACFAQAELDRRSEP